MRRDHHQHQLSTRSGVDFKWSAGTVPFPALETEVQGARMQQVVVGDKRENLTVQFAKIGDLRLPIGLADDSIF